LGKVDEADIAGDAPADLIAAMKLAADRDLVARQYTNDFHEVLEVVVPTLSTGIAQSLPLAEVIVHAHLRLLSAYPDSLIARKCGLEVAEQASVMAAKVLASGRPGDHDYREALLNFDFWLRSDHHRRNPGTTADLVAAGLFAALREGIIKLPVRFYE
jgi:triphosphoribosyl-dephospho-CoA synthase